MVKKDTKKGKPQLKGSLGKLIIGAAQLAKERDENVNKTGTTESAQKAGEEKVAELVISDQAETSEHLANEPNEASTREVEADPTGKSAKRSRVKKTGSFDAVFIKDARMTEEKNRSTALAASNYKVLEMLAKAGGTSIISLLNNVVKEWRELNEDDINVWKQKYIDEL